MMTKPRSFTKTIMLLAGFIFTMSIGFYLGIVYSKNQDSNYGIIFDGGPELEEIQHATDEFLQAYNEADLQGIGKTYAKDGVFMPPNLPSIYGRSNIVKFFQKEVVDSNSKLEIAETVEEVIYFKDWAVMRGLGEISITIPESTSNNIQFKWAMLSKKNPEGKWESVWDIYNDI
ncbi:YybH family protein [Seonamhaeicola maritimus]|uniref:YybH family protein n=1 Tax=Seonamhaeicola maritimus TaxID=2591822 RepID=UPI002494EAC3|nr:DUF4440 domain-containing protein [Seonamhaeicola maritimus]